MSATAHITERHATALAPSVDTHAGKIAYAVANSRCFACDHYCRPFKTFSSRCQAGAPSWAYKGDSTVRWDNGCDRFTPARTVAAGMGAGR
jgi:hypothetical protein